MSKVQQKDDVELSTTLNTSYYSLKEETDLQTAPKQPELKKQNSSGSKTKTSEHSRKEKKREKKVAKFKWTTYRFLLGYPIKHWKLTILTNILIILGSILTVYLPWLVGQLLDSTTNYQNLEDAKIRHSKLVWKFLVVMTLLGLVSFIRNFVDNIWQNALFNDMRYDVMAQFLSFDINFYQQYKTGQIMSRLMSDIQAAKNAVSSNLVTLLRNLVMTFSNITILFYISWQLTSAVLVIMPFFGAATFIFSRISKRFAKENQQYVADMTSSVEEIFNGITTIKSFNGEGKSLKRYDDHLKTIRNLVVRRALNSSIYQFNSVFLRQLGTLVVLWYGGLLVLDKDSLTAGELASFILYTLQLSNSSQQLSGTYSSIITATGSFEGVLDMLQYQPVVKDTDKHRDLSKLKGDLEFKNVSFEYPQTNVMILKNINIKIQQGEYLAFVGRSGSGKSTIVKLLERFYDPTVGNIYLDGVNIKDVNIHDLRCQIGLVSQEPTLFAGTIESNITYGVEQYSHDDLIWASKASGAWSFITDKQLFPLGLNTNVGEKGVTLSGGQKQRIAIARALIKKPKILIFDEATSALDGESEQLIQQQIDELINYNKEISIIVIAHRLSTIVNCNRIVVLKHGEIVEMGNHQELLQNNGIYKQLIERQMQGYNDESQVEESDC